MVCWQSLRITIRRRRADLIRYYTELAASVKLPIIMYNVPGRTGCNILPETAAELFHHVENIVGLKEATGNVAQVVRQSCI